MPESRFEALRHTATEKLAIGLSIVSLAGGVAVTEQANPEPAIAAEATPTLQDCAEQLAKPPTGTKAERIGLSGKSMVIEVEGNYPGASGECTEILEANSVAFNARVKVKIVACHGIYRNKCFPLVRKTTADTGIADGLEAQKKDARVYSNEGYPGVSVCVPGDKKSSRTVTFINKVTKNRHILAQTSKTIRVGSKSDYC